MKQDHQNTFGRRITAAHPKSNIEASESGLVDKWQLLTALTEAATAFNLNHRTLSVLRALISFHPDRMIAPSPRSTIVFPANKTLSNRLGGMPESTLRRHLAALVSTGLVSRHDSANRKRFARNMQGGAQVAFGFDLSHLAALAPSIFQAATRASERRAELNALRAKVAAIRQQVIELSGYENALTDEAFLTLRRKPDETALHAMYARLTTMLEATATQKVSGLDDQNERHIQTENLIYSEQRKHGKSIKPEPLFERVVKNCSEYQSFFPQPPRNWQDLSRVAYELIPMMGIDRQVYGQAVKVMGPERAISSVLYILEMLGTIQNPGGYLRRLIQQHAAGQFDIYKLLANIGSDGKANIIVS
jgi:replication initiation protein RepC